VKGYGASIGAFVYIKICDPQSESKHSSTYTETQCRIIAKADLKLISSSTAHEL
jgi:hypothetical protein